MNEMNNRVCCLYRVSTDKQVDFNSNHEADLPMQRKACHKFAEAKGWVIVCWCSCSIESDASQMKRRLL